MTQANQVLATIANPVNDWETLIEQDTIKIQEDLNIKPTKAKKKKQTGTRRAERGRKKPYTEDCICFYTLQGCMGGYNIVYLRAFSVCTYIFFVN